MRRSIYLVGLAALLSVGCGSGTEISDTWKTITDPTARGLTKVAVAIVAAAIIRGVMHK